MSDSSDAVTQRAQARVGQVLRSKWRLDKLLGVGGMAAVYAATHRNGKRGAVKMLHLELSIDAEAKSRFLREGYVANKVDHPGAVSVLDDDASEDGSVFLVMELLEGQSLEARADAAPGRRLPVEEVVSIADQLLDVLAAAHEKGIVHRDLKPENLLLTRHGQVKVLDFGIARLREMSAGAQATRTGSVMGTPAFMPPEQALGNWNQVDGRTDLWATGATIFRLLSGRAVHEGDNVNKVLLAAMTKPAAPLATVAPGTHPGLCAIVDRALAFEPTHRWPDARAMQAALREIVRSSGIAPSSLGASTAPVSGPFGPWSGSQPGGPHAPTGVGMVAQQAVGVPQAPPQGAAQVPPQVPPQGAPQVSPQGAPQVPSQGAIPSMAGSLAYATASPVTVTAVQPPRSSFAGLVVAAAAVVVLGIGGTVAYFVTRDRGPAAATDVPASSTSTAAAASAAVSATSTATGAEVQPSATAAGAEVQPTATASTASATATATASAKAPASAAAAATSAAGGSTAKPTTTAKPATSGKKKDVFDKF